MTLIDWGSVERRFDVLGYPSLQKARDIDMDESELELIGVLCGYIAQKCVCVCALSSDFLLYYITHRHAFAWLTPRKIQIGIKFR